MIEEKRKGLLSNKFISQKLESMKDQENLLSLYITFHI
jgi:hypothetical protein